MLAIYTDASRGRVTGLAAVAKDETGMVVCKANKVVGPLPPHLAELEAANLGVELGEKLGSSFLILTDNLAVVSRGLRANHLVEIRHIAGKRNTCAHHLAERTRERAERRNSLRNR